ncbi:hypothetical protein KC325_g87 [Hortaea werneckii]|nr:hypothetical protein KC325_g87 [Hortaea werneckii]
MANENIFDNSFNPNADQLATSPSRVNSPESMVPPPAESDLPSRRTPSPVSLEPSASSASTTDSASGLPGLARISTSDANEMSGLAPPRPPKASLKRTYTDVAGLSLQNRLTEAMAKPYHANEGRSGVTTPNAPTIPQPQPRNSTVVERAPHGHRHQQAQAIFTTEARSPWTITAANDLACLVFGVTRAEVRKLGIMEVIKEERRNPVRQVLFRIWVTE